MKPDRFPITPMPEEVRRHVEEHDPHELREVEQVWEVLELARGRYARQASVADATWQQLAGSLFPPEPTPSLREERPPVMRARRRWPILTGAVATVLLLVALAYVLVPVRVEVPYGETATVVLPDDSRVELNSGSVLTYRRGFKTLWQQAMPERMVTLEGEGFFTVSEEGRPFRVATYNAEVEVLGTVFNVKSWPESPANDTRVTVQSGHVRVSPGNVDLLANQSARVADGAATQTTYTEQDIDLVLNWRNRGFSVMDEPLQAAFMQLERQYGVDIQVLAVMQPHPQIVYYRNEPNLEILLGDICSAYGLKYRKTVRGYEVYR